MTKTNFTEFCDSKAFRIPYYLSAVFFSFLCALSTNLLFDRNPNKFFLVFLTAVYFSAFVAASAVITKRGYVSKQNLNLYIGAFFCTYGFSVYMEVEKSLVWLILYGFNVLFLRHALKIKSTRQQLIASGIIGWIFAAFMFVGWQLESCGYLQIMYTEDMITFGLLCIYFSALALFFISVLNTFINAILNKDFSVEADKKIIKKDSMLFLCYLLVILICWLPYYYAFFPGDLNSDSLSEIRQQLGIQPLSNHHPIMHQLLIGFSLKLANYLPQTGVAIYSTIQMLLLSVSFALSLVFLRKKGVGRGIRTAALMFYALFPVNPFFAMTMWKDVPFGAICLLLMLLLLRETSTDAGKCSGEENVCRKLFNLVLLITAAFFFCTLRNNGWYAFLLGFPIYICIYTKSSSQSWKRLGFVLIAVILLVSGYNHIIFDELGIKKSAAGEALSIPLQQIARTVKYNPDALNTEEAVVLNEVFPEIESLGEKYDPTLSDNVKSPTVFLSEVFSENPLRYLKSWATLGMKYPSSYIDAFLMQNYGYWYPDTTYVIVNSDVHPNDLGIAQREKLETMRYEIIRSYAVLSTARPTAILYSLGLMVWLMIIAAALLILKGQGSFASPILILAGLWLTTLASPVYCEYRYMYGFVTCVPLFLGLALGLKNRNRAGN